MDDWKIVGILEAGRRGGGGREMLSGGQGGGERRGGGRCSEGSGQKESE